MMLADPGLVIIEPVEMLDQLHVPFDGKRRILAKRVEGREKDSGAEIAVLHGGLPRISVPTEHSPFRQNHLTLRSHAQRGVSKGGTRTLSVAHQAAEITPRQSR